MIKLDEVFKFTHTFNPVLADGEICKEIEITVRSKDHPVVKQVSRELSLEVQQREATKKKRGGDSAGQLTEEDLDYYEQMGLRRAVSRVESIKGASEGGKEVGGDKELIALVLNKYSDFLDQVMKEADLAANFCK
jgi:hypothetical protein